MKKFFILCVILIFTASIHAQSRTTLIPQASKVNAETSKKIRSGKAYLVDVRTPEEFNSGHPKFAKNINYNGTDFKTQIPKLDKNKPVNLYCRSRKQKWKSG